MADKIKILFNNRDGAGVNYFRTLTPAMELERNHSEEFHVDINADLDFSNNNIVDYLKSYHIIHYHRQLAPDVPTMMKLKNALKDSGTLLIMDIDDYWHLNKKHPYHDLSVEQKLHLEVTDNLKIADYVTTTTDLFASEIRKVTGKDNVIALYNSIDPTWMKQFQDNRTPDPNGLVRITYMAGSSHMGDVEQLESVVNFLDADPETRGKFKITLSGWDTEGTTTEVKFNEEFSADLQKRGLWTREMIKNINKTKGNVDLIPKLPPDIKNKFRGKVFTSNQRSINSEESVYLFYEKILTDNHRLIKNSDYLTWLKNYERNLTYPNEGNYARRWTQKANIYASVLDETDIVLAPLADNMFNNMKSNLKQVECWSRKLPIVCSDIAPYNVDGVNGHNCILIPAEKNAHKYWKKELKKLIIDAELRNKLGNQLFEDFKDKYHLATVTKKRAEFYKEAVTKTLQLV
jgi:glycosyltransferase involved in cell wall biosynthesis